MSSLKRDSRSNYFSLSNKKTEEKKVKAPTGSKTVNSSSKSPQLYEKEAPKAYLYRRLRGGRKGVVHRSSLHDFISKKPWSEVEQKFDYGLTSSGGCRVSNKHYYIESEDAELASSFVDLNTTYRFRLGGHATMSATLGVVNTFFACDPSAAGLNFPEWSTLSALFSEFKLVMLKLQVCRNQNTAVIAAAPLMFAGNLGTAIAPGSYAALADNADAKLWAGYSDASAHGHTHSLHGTQLNWSEVTTPTTNPYAGAPGSIQVYSNTVFAGTSANDAYHVLVSAIYDFRSRV